MNWRRGKMKKKRSHQGEVRGAIIELLTVSSVCVCMLLGHRWRQARHRQRHWHTEATGLLVAVVRTPFKAFYKFCKLTQIESIIWAKCRQRLNWKKI